MEHSNARPYPKSFDAYLKYAIQTDFAYFAAFGHARQLTLILLVELKRDANVEEFTKQFRSLGLKDVFVNSTELSGRARMPTRFLTIRGPVDLVAVPTWDVWDALTSFVELSLPIRPGQAADIEDFFPKRPKSQSDIEIGRASCRERV